MGGNGAVAQNFPVSWVEGEIDDGGTLPVATGAAVGMALHSQRRYGCNLYRRGSRGAKALIASGRIPQPNQPFPFGFEQVSATRSLGQMLANPLTMN